ncbi:hypothetical protein [Litchfieldia alkalitelluris]|uniref:hypothetical protein n=1 Tax=Litchfieldia alkalitelluris TaxID=304268 RepID=UPI000998C3B4|nr:hypothetical protein [Litchfieldia alkalitelluris]
MKKITMFLILVFVLVSLTAFDMTKKSDIEVTGVDITIMEQSRILRYDFTLKNNGKKVIGEGQDYPGHHGIYLNLAVRPNEKLESLMEMESTKSHKKMAFRGGGGEGSIQPGKEGSFSLEYQIKMKKDVDFEAVSESALDATLIVLDGWKVIAEIPLSQE